MFQLGHQARLLGPVQMWCGLLSKPEIIRRMRRADRLPFPTLLQALPPVLADRLQHEQAWLTAGLLHLAQQVILQQHTHPIQDVASLQASRVGDGLDSLKRTAPSEDREPTEELLLGVGKQLVAPGDGRPHGLLAGGGVACAASEHLQGLAETGEQGLRREQPSACGGQLDRQGQPIQAQADFGNRPHGRLRDLERRLGGLHALDEERAGAILQQGL
ncbi:MAG TPA: hypothetical protein VF026_11780 [Ktedonobacteraceae bacterium]